MPVDALQPTKAFSMTTEVEVKIRRVGKFIGGPYDGAEIRGWSIPDTVIVDDQSMRFDNCKVVHTKATGRYTAGEAYVNLYDQPMEFYDLLNTDERLLEDAEAEVSDDGTRTVLLFIEYQWTHDQQKAAT